MPKYHKLQRAACLSLFVISSLASYIKPHLVPIAALSLIGVIAYDIVCYFKGQLQIKDNSVDMAKMAVIQEELVAKVADIRNDASIGKLAETFRRNK